MRLVRPHQSECDFAREAISLALDDDLSDFAALRLEGHLETCPSCRDFASQTSAFTGALRNAKPEPLPFSIVLPRRRWAPSHAFQAGAIAAVVGIVASTALVGGVGQRQVSNRQDSGLPAPAHPFPSVVKTAEVRIFQHDSQPQRSQPKRKPI